MFFAFLFTCCEVLRILVIAEALLLSETVNRKNGGLTPGCSWRSELLKEGSRPTALSHHRLG